MVDRPRIVVVDDDEDVRRYVAALLAGRGYPVACAASGDQALSLLASPPPPGAVLLDLLMPQMSGLDLLDRIRKSHPHLPIIVLSAMGQIKTVVEAVKRGASDYLAKPFDTEELELAIESALDKETLRQQVRTLQQQLDQYSEPGEFILSSARMARVREIARQVADTDAPVLILGESGVGKEVLARFIHAQSGRRDKPWVKVNCAALPQELLESELFGYERGAFSGAVRQKPGKFELANQGSILLDEIAEMSPSLQAKLLQVLQDGEFSRLGATRTNRVDARILASTNVRLDVAVSSGRFREDLYFRLNVIRLEIPPLRERREDIPVLAQHFLKLYSARYGSTLEEVPEALMEAFRRHDWPGNVRELANAVRRYVILPDLEAARAELRPSSLATSLRTEDPALTEGPATWSLKEAASRAAGEVEREMIRKVLEETHWNRREAARRLKISYKALLSKIKRWEVGEPRVTDGGL